MTATGSLAGNRRRRPALRPLATGEATGVVDRARVVSYEGDRIYFRPLEVEDEAMLRRWVNDPRNWRGLNLRPPLNACREREWIENLGKSQTDYVFGIVVRDGDRLIGTTGLHRINANSRKAELGINLGEVACQNKGYGTEAVRLVCRYGFEELNLNRIGLSVFSNNLRAIRCYQKAGFVHEGCLRQALYRNGQFHDEYRFAMLRSEWDELDA
jgi:RimJ/RimL family protein N-acetyltransferase